MSKPQILALVLILTVGPVALLDPAIIRASSDERVSVHAGPLSSPRLSPLIPVHADSLENNTPRAAYNQLHDEYLVVWQEGDTLSGQRLNGAGNVVGDVILFPIGYPGAPPIEPNVAYSPLQDEYLIVYASSKYVGYYNVYGVRMRWDGGAFSSEIDISTMALRNCNEPSVSYNAGDDEYLVVYTQREYWLADPPGIKGRRIQAGTGIPIGLSATISATSEYSPGVVYRWTGNNYFIVYSRRPAAGRTVLTGRLASANLGTLSGEIPLADSDTNKSSVSLAAGTNEFLAVWDEGPVSAAHRVLAQRIEAGGTMTEPRLVIADNVPISSLSARVAYSPVFGYLITWYQENGGFTEGDVYGRFYQAEAVPGLGAAFILDDRYEIQREPFPCCSSKGDCLVVERDQYGPLGPQPEYDITGFLLTAHRAFLPLAVKD